DPTVSAAVESTVADLQAAASTIARQIEVLAAGTNREIDAAFARLAQTRSDALLVSPFPLFYERRVQILTLAARHAIPAIYPAREWAEAGGMMSYESSFNRPVPPDRHLYRPRSQGREAGRPADPAGHQIRVGHQSANGEDVWHRGAADAARPRRRGHRMKRRAFITLLGAVTWPLAVRAQQHKMLRVGFVGMQPREALKFPP